MTDKSPHETITDDMLVFEFPHLGSVQRVYRLPNGFGLSAVNAPILHYYPFVWEIAVVEGMTEEGNFKNITYDTSLTSDVEVFSTITETNQFIAKAKNWADAMLAERDKS